MLRLTCSRCGTSPLSGGCLHPRPPPQNWPGFFCIHSSSWLSPLLKKPISERTHLQRQVSTEPPWSTRCSGINGEQREPLCSVWKFRGGCLRPRDDMRSACVMFGCPQVHVRADIDTSWECPMGVRRCVCGGVT